MVQPKVKTINNQDNITDKNGDISLEVINEEYDRWSNILSDRYNKWLAMNKQRTLNIEREGASRLKEDRIRI